MALTYPDMHPESFISMAFKDQIGGKAQSTTISQLRVLFQTLLPVCKRDVDAVLQLIRTTQWKNHSAYGSHRKKRVSSHSLLW